MADILTGLVAHWKLDEPSGTVATDSSGSGYTGTYVNSPALNQVGAFGSSTAVAFTGASTHKITLGSTALLRNVSACSVAAWLKWSGTGEQGVINIAGASTTARLSLHVNYTGNGNVRVGARAGDGESLQAVLTTAATFNNGVWHHVVGTVNYVTDTVLIYVDGVLKSTTGTPAFTANATSNTDSPSSRLGCGIFDSFYYTGTLDDVRIYNRVLSSDDVTALHAYTGATAGALRFATFYAANLK